MPTFISATPPNPNGGLLAPYSCIWISGFLPMTIWYNTGVVANTKLMVYINEGIQDPLRNEPNLPPLESGWKTQPPHPGNLATPRPEPCADQGVGPTSNPAGTQGIIRTETRAITPARIRPRQNLWCTLTRPRSSLSPPGLCLDAKRSVPDGAETEHATGGRILRSRKVRQGSQTQP